MCMDYEKGWVLEDPPMCIIVVHRLKFSYQRENIMGTPIGLKCYTDHFLLKKPMVRYPRIPVIFNKIFVPGGKMYKFWNVKAIKRVKL